MNAIHGCTTRIIPYVFTWDGIVTKLDKSYSQQIGLGANLHPIHSSEEDARKHLHLLQDEWRRPYPRKPRKVKRKAREGNFPTAIPGEGKEKAE